MRIKRILLIDQCMRDTTRKYTLDDLIRICSETEPVSKRSIQLDLEMMRSHFFGYGAPIIVKERKYYTYADPKFSILNEKLTKKDLSEISEAFETLGYYSRFKKISSNANQLFNLHNSIAAETGIPRPIKDKKESGATPTQIRVWVSSEKASHFLENPIAENQQLEYVEIDGSLSLLLSLVVTPEVEKFFIENQQYVKITKPTSLRNKLLKKSGE